MRLNEIFNSKVTENGDLAFNKVGDNTLVNILFLTEYYQKHLNEVPTLGDSDKEQLFAMFIRDPRFGMAEIYTELVENGATPIQALMEWN